MSFLLALTIAVLALSGLVWWSLRTVRRDGLGSDPSPGRQDWSHRTTLEVLR